MRHSWRASWKHRNTWLARFTTCISNRSTRSSGHERSGAFRMLSRQRSRNSTRFRNSRRRRSWASSWRPDSRKLFNAASRPVRTTDLLYPCYPAGVPRRPTLPPDSLISVRPFTVSLRMADNPGTIGRRNCSNETLFLRRSSCLKSLRSFGRIRQENQRNRQSPEFEPTYTALQFISMPSRFSEKGEQG